MAKRFNIRAFCREPSVRATQGAVELRFASLDSNRPLPQKMAKLKSTVLSADATEHCIVQRPLSNGTEFVFSIFLPDAGEYGLEIYVTDPQIDGSTPCVVSAAYNYSLDDPLALPSYFPSRV
ncbi:unnamed protein product [Dibothriocephalus latus]|uniref:Uncharacterized protein n=1 Tax=Dibothriocephalus latus TaxID=60516 RepID=A0A3P7MZI7_DIBLA|nr:unnamed protein product [Dibothriocephalus latus]